MNVAEKLSAIISASCCARIGAVLYSKVCRKLLVFHKCLAVFRRCETFENQLTAENLTDTGSQLLDLPEPQDTYKVSTRN